MAKYCCDDILFSTVVHRCDDLISLWHHFIVMTSLRCVHVTSLWRHIVVMPYFLCDVTSMGWRQLVVMVSLRCDDVTLSSRSSPVPEKDTGKLCQHIQFEAADINEFEYKLHEWVLQRSNSEWYILDHFTCDKVDKYRISLNKSLGVYSLNI